MLMVRMLRWAKIPAVAIVGIEPTISLAAERTARSSHAKKTTAIGYRTPASPSPITRQGKRTISREKDHRVPNAQARQIDAKGHMAHSTVVRAIRPATAK